MNTEVLLTVYGLKSIIPKNAGSHNSIYRGEDITDLFYNGTLTTQIAAGTFDDIFVGDYIIGNVSNTKYLVADIDYRYNSGDTLTTTHHILMFPETIMGREKMNDTATTTGAYTGSKMRTTTLSTYQTIIQNDFGSNHILQHRNRFAKAVNNGCESSTDFYDSVIDLMNEHMVYGCDVWHNLVPNSNMTVARIDKKQLSIFRYRPDLILAKDTNNVKKDWWLRDVSNSTKFACITDANQTNNLDANNNMGIRPAFLIY